AGTLLLVGTDPTKIEAEAAKLLGDPAAYAAVSSANNPYGDGFAAERIVSAMEFLLTGKSPPVPFGSGFNRREIGAASGLHLREYLERVTADESTSSEHAELDAREQFASGSWPP
ncbi:MAG: UDP-N-acetylglucosamine 2-epimerase, partial [Solirubrobacterales bacterium]